MNFEFLNNELKRLELDLLSYPSGDLHCCKNGNHYKHYHSVGKKCSYIPVSNSLLIHQLAKKKYIECRIKDIKAELLFLKQKEIFEKHSRNVDNLLKHPEFFKILKRRPSASDIDVEAWASEPFEANPHFPEGLNVPTIAGHMVRSKSEALISTLLTNKGIPYRYEAAYMVDGLVFHPDFTILHPQTKKLFYWEHFGLMDEPDYARNASEKIYKYSRNGIILGDNLIITSETQEHPLDIAYANTLIEYYFN